ncbi:MAG TPA: hypothetical protein VMB34_23695 [Acetobacteraceae bacterium]|nr:hypothetical protein [Acetobacteraceae bacterium]
MHGIAACPSLPPGSHSYQGVFWRGHESLNGLLKVLDFPPFGKCTWRYGRQRAEPGPSAWPNVQEKFATDRQPWRAGRMRLHALVIRHIPNTLHCLLFLAPPAPPPERRP